MRVQTALLVVVLSLACETDKTGLTAPNAPNVSASISPDRKKPHLLDGIHLSAQERSSIFAINHRYNEQFNELRLHSSNPKGRVDDATLLRIRALRTRQLTEWKAVMSPDNAAKFETNRRLSSSWRTDMKAKFQALHR